jgi:hypothetical protein
MGVFSDFIVHSQLVDREAPRTAQARIVYKELDQLQRRVDPIHGADFEADAEIQTTTTYPLPLNQYKIRVTLQDKSTVDTVSMGTQTYVTLVQTNLDTACAAIPGYTAGDIVVSGFSLFHTGLTFTFSGASVLGLDWDDLQFWQTAPVLANISVIQSTIQDGAPIRYSWSVMNALGMVTTPPARGASLSNDFEWTLGPDANPKWPSAAMREVLAWQTAIDENNMELYTQLKHLFNIG